MFLKHKADIIKVKSLPHKYHKKENIISICKNLAFPFILSSRYNKMTDFCLKSKHNSILYSFYVYENTVDVMWYKLYLKKRTTICLEKQ